MKWTEFMMILIGIYFAYYGLNLVFDLLNSGARPLAASDDDSVLHFTEDEPELIIPAGSLGDGSALEEKAIASSKGAETPSPGGLISTGSVSIKQLFELAKDDLIEYTRAISY